MLIWQLVFQIPIFHWFNIKQEIYDIFCLYVINLIAKTYEDVLEETWFWQL